MAERWMFKEGWLYCNDKVCLLHYFFCAASNCIRANENRGEKKSGSSEATAFKNEWFLEQLWEQKCGDESKGSKDNDFRFNPLSLSVWQMLYSIRTEKMNDSRNHLVTLVVRTKVNLVYEIHGVNCLYRCF